MRTLIRVAILGAVAIGIGGLIGVSSGQRADQVASSMRVSVRLPPVQEAAIPAPRPVPEPPPAIVAPPAATPEPAAKPVGATPAWQRHAVAVAVPPGRKTIAIVIDDMGVDRVRSDRAAALPAPLTLAFLPYARGFEAQLAAARARGHEILVHVPMQPLGSEDTGPDALTVALDRGEIRRRLAAALDRAGPAVGINNHMGSRFTADRDAMRPVIEELRARGLLFLDSLTTSGSVGAALAREIGVPYAVRDVFLDNDSAPAAVRARLAELELMAVRQGHAVGIGHPHDGTLEALASWMPDAATRGFAFVPVSEIVRAMLERRQRS